MQKHVHFTLGTKVEHNDYTGFEFEPSGRLQWDITPKQMIWAAVSRAVRTPSRLDRDLFEPTYFNFPPATVAFLKGLGFTLPSSALDGSTTFKSETLIAYELGYRAQLGDKLSGSVSTYYNDYGDIRSTTTGPVSSFGAPIVFQNNLEGRNLRARGKRRLPIAGLVALACRV